jgi:GNAT superfamily N-acetyltransferase
VEERYRFEPLEEKHLPLWQAFVCGEEALDRYLREEARREMEQRIAAVWILYDREANQIAGFYTLSAATVKRADLPPELTHRMARYEVHPATVIGRLAVDQEYQNQRVGGRPLLDALTRLLAAFQFTLPTISPRATHGETGQSCESKLSLRLSPSTK